MIQKKYLTDLDNNIICIYKEGHPLMCEYNKIEITVFLQMKENIHYKYIISKINDISKYLKDIINDIT